MFDWPKWSKKTDEAREKSKLDAELREVELHLKTMGYDLQIHGVRLAILELASGYNAVETASHIALTTLARDVSEAIPNLLKLMPLLSHGNWLLKVLKEYKDNSRMHPTQWQNDSTAVLRIITVDNQQQAWLREILADPLAGKERIAVSRLDYAKMLRDP